MQMQSFNFFFGIQLGVLVLMHTDNISSVFVEVIMPKGTNIIFGCIYRHADNNTDDFNTNYLRPLLEKLSKNCQKTFFYLVALILNF